MLQKTQKSAKKAQKSAVFSKKHLHLASKVLI